MPETVGGLGSCCAVTDSWFEMKLSFRNTSDCGKGISETGYYLIVVPSPLQASGAAAAAPLAFLRAKTFHDSSETFHDIGGCIPAPFLLI